MRSYVIVAILQRCHAKALQRNVPPTEQYSLDQPDVHDLETIIEKESFLLSAPLRDQWNTLHLSKGDLITKLKTGTSIWPNGLNLPLQKMREIAESDFNKLNEQCYAYASRWTLRRRTAILE